MRSALQWDDDSYGIAIPQWKEGFIEQMASKYLLPIVDRRKLLKARNLKCITNRHLIPLM